MPLNLNAQLSSFGFDVFSIDRHNYSELLDSLRISRENLPSRPVAIIANTTKGKGIPLIENKR
jgi:transketolase